MPTYLLTWNPKRWRWDDIQQRTAEIQEKGYSLTDWSCGRSKRICRGDRLFMIRLGHEPRGIFASGYAISSVYENQHWDESISDQPARYVDIRLEVLLDPDQEAIFPRSALNEGILKNMHWDSQSSGIGIPEEIGIELEEKWADFLASQGTYENTSTRHFFQPELYIERHRIEVEGYFDAETLEDARQRVTASIVQRQGQSGFRRKLLAVYGGRCPITGCDVEPALEAAHIIPYKGVSTNHPTNGLLLRADVHTLFDLHLISIQPDTCEVVVASGLATTCYGDLAGKKLALPNHSISPDKTALKKHYEIFVQRCVNQ